VENNSVNKLVKRPTIAAVLISKNAASVLDDCLESVAWVDEIIILDNGSDDESLEIAQKYNAKVIVETQWHGFGPQRQLAQSHTSADWLFWIDTDERVSDDLKHSLETLLTSEDLDPQKAYSVPRISDFFGRLMRHSGWYPDKVVRFHHRLSYQYNDVQVHEKLDVANANVEDLTGDLIHLTSEDFCDYFSKSARYAENWGRERAEKGKTISIAGIVLKMLAAFIRVYVVRAGFLDGKHGLLLSIQTSHYVFNKYFSLWVYSKGYRTLPQKK
tara:strand:+ start:312 stop:1127 length:816 start_codon:yes stop_codon:yes gene_type:complete